MNNPLAELKDIHTPDGISLWPPAYGWWLLAVVLIIIILWLSLLIYRNYKRGLAKRQALRELNALDVNSHGWRVSLNSLLKRLILSYQPALPVQQLYGEELTRLLSTALPAKMQDNFQQQMTRFQQTLYQTQPSSLDDFNANKGLVSNWIKTAKLDNKKVKQALVACCATHLGKQQGVKHV